MKIIHMFYDYFYIAAEKLMPLLPDWITGESQIFHQKYRTKYGIKDCHDLIRRRKTGTMAAYLMTTIIFVIILATSIIIQIHDGKEITAIKRPTAGEPEMVIPVEVQMRYKGYELEKSISLKIPEKAMTKDEKQKQLLIMSKKLNQIILGENTDLKHISKNLNLIERDAETGAFVDWESSSPEIVDKKGNVNLLEAEDHGEVVLKASLTLDDSILIKTYRLEIDTAASKEDYIRNMEENLEASLAKTVENDTSSEIVLPSKLKGADIRWFAGQNNGISVIIILFIIIILLVYFKRYDKINSEIKEAEESIARDLPEFMNKLVLLLNAGLVITSAIRKIASDYEAFHCGFDSKQIKKRYLYEELTEIQKRVAKSNSSLMKELKDFAQRSGVREFVRITAIIADNWDKGSTMVEKLQGESELLWISRKKRAEERGRIAETKLTFPLMILLIVLIMLTIAPALMEM